MPHPSPLLRAPTKPHIDDLQSFLERSSLSHLVRPLLEVGENLLAMNEQMKKSGSSITCLGRE